MKNPQWEKTEYSGVRREIKSGYYRVAVRIGGKTRFVGTFLEADVAAKAADCLSLRFPKKGERKLNFPGEMNTYLAIIDETEAMFEGTGQA